MVVYIGFNKHLNLQFLQEGIIDIGNQESNFYEEKILHTIKRILRIVLKIQFNFDH